ncbi:MAG: response regulator transcription factor [Clostridiales bacterium]|nr:response regulator transcription factor [Clostridiales bacterium]
MTNVLIVEDQRMMRETMENYIKQSDGYCLAGSIPGASFACKFCAHNRVELVLMDVCTENDESGFEATKKLKADFPDIKVIIVTSMLDTSYLVRAREVGADSIWFKDVSREELMSVVERTMRGESVYPDRTPEIMIGNASSYEFTEAEIKVLRVLVEGMTYKEMADALEVSVETVKSHVGNMLLKTGFASKTKLAAMVMSKRLIVNGF